MVFDAQDLIEQAINRHKGRVAVACSFGKDSISVVHMAIQIDPNIPIIFENSGVEFPETIKYKNRLVKEWHLNIHETKPIKTFWECAKEYGLPKARKSGGEGRNGPPCCQYLKEKPGLAMQRDLGIEAVITGMQACESQNRALLAKRYDNGKAKYMTKDDVEFCSQRWYTRSTNTWVYHPIMLWSTKQVWDYIYQHDIPVNEVYTKWLGLYPRCGCLPCTAYNSWKERLQISHPKLYGMLLKMGK